MTIPFESEYRQIPLSRGQFALVDAEDYERLAAVKWHAKWSPKTKSYYAVRREWIRGGKGKQRNRQMHREVLGLGPAKEDSRLADHIHSGDTLDNRKANLRIASPSQNSANSRPRGGTIGGYKGVYFQKDKNRYFSTIYFNGKKVWGCFGKTAEECFEKRKVALPLFHGEFARF